MATTAAMDDLTAVPVYDLALKLRAQFDGLIAVHGPGPYEAIVPLVVRALEQLEGALKQCDAARDQADELSFTIERLHAEKQAKAAERDKYQKVCSVMFGYAHWWK